MKQRLFCVLILLLGCMQVDAVEGSTLRENFAQLTREVRSALKPVPNKSTTTVVITGPIMLVSLPSLQSGVMTAFEEEFLDRLAKASGRNITYHDDAYYPELRDIYRKELIRNLDAPTLMEKIYNDYLSEGTYDYIIVPRIEENGGQLTMAVLMVGGQGTGVERHLSRTVSVDRVLAERPSVSLDAYGYQQGVDTIRVFRTESGAFRRVPESPSYTSFGLGLASMSPRFFGRLDVLGQVGENPEDFSNFEYTNSDIQAFMEWVVAKGAKYGVVLGGGLDIFEQNYRESAEDVVPVFSTREETQSVGMGLLRGNLMNGVMLTVWGFQSDAEDTSPGADFFLNSTDLWSSEGWLVSLRGRLSRGKHQLSVFVRRGSSDVEFNTQYFGIPLEDAVENVDAGFDYAYLWGDNFRLLFFGQFYQKDFSETIAESVVGLGQENTSFLGLGLGFRFGS